MESENSMNQENSGQERLISSSLLHSSPSSGSLPPYDERQAYSKQAQPPVTSVYSRPRARRSTSNSSDHQPPRVPTLVSKKQRQPSHQSLQNNSTTRPHSPLRFYADNPSSAPPSLRTIYKAMRQYLVLYWKHYSPAVCDYCRKTRRKVCYGMGILICVILLWLSFMARDFYMDAVQICVLPPSIIQSTSTRPLVEYYVHGRGNGHSARTMAIIDVLNEAGVDIRMFIGRASIWNVASPAGANSTTSSTQSNYNRGVTTAIPVTSITPSLGIFSSLSHILERIMGDCEVAMQTKRYPMLVVSDGDMPGMLRAKLGGIPSVGISHGQVFSIALKPEWVRTDARLNKAWDAEKRLNRATAWFSSWQIGTNFVPLEPSMSSAAVARPPLRQEVKQMRTMRATMSRLAVAKDVAHRMDRILRYGSDVDESITNVTLPELRRVRKLVLCYFRDRNGKVVADALLQAGFDVILFDSGYSVDADWSDPHRYGRKWIVPKKYRLKLRKKAKLEPSDDHAHGRRLTDEMDATTGDPRLIRVTDRSLFVPFMSIADGIASSAGSQLLSECIYTNIPLLALHKANDNEQMLNVEMSRHARSTTHPDLSVFGDLLEHFTEAFSGGAMSQLRHSSHNRSVLTTSKRTKQLSAGAKIAAAEFEGFMARVQASHVAEHYIGMLAAPGTSFGNETTVIAPADEDGDPFRGMPDAPGIMLEIIKQVQKDNKARLMY